MDLLERFWRRAISVQPHTQLGEIPLDIPPTELDYPRCPISTPIDLSRHGETHLTRSTCGGFADGLSPASATYVCTALRPFSSSCAYTRLPCCIPAHNTSVIVMTFWYVFGTDLLFFELFKLYSSFGIDHDPPCSLCSHDLCLFLFLCFIFHTIIWPREVIIVL